VGHSATQSLLSHLRSVIIVRYESIVVSCTLKNSDCAHHQEWMTLEDDYDFMLARN
jgi:hypothetical protein